MVTQRSKFLAELKKELGKRVQVWKGTVIEKENKVSFVSLEHERRYKELAQLRQMVEHMTDAEVNRFVERAKTAIQPPVTNDLFT